LANVTYVVLENYLGVGDDSFQSDKVPDIDGRSIDFHSDQSAIGAATLKAGNVHNRQSGGCLLLVRPDWASTDAVLLAGWIADDLAGPIFEIWAIVHLHPCHIAESNALRLRVITIY
jgi:hypothetical protein